MDIKRGIGKTGLVATLFVATGLCILSYIFHPIEISPIQYGLCLPSPDSWGFETFRSWIINTALIFLIALLLFIVNKSYNFVRTTDPAITVVFLIMTCSCPWFTQSINTAVLLCLANVVGMGIIFDSYASRNATREMFILGVVAGIGSMVQYAFLPLAFVFLVWALFMKVLRIKETLAFITGILCPYWIALGIGWIHFSDFHYPSITPLFSNTNDPSEFFLLLAATAIAAAFGFLITFINTIKLYAGNSRVNAMNLCVSTLGAAMTVCILVDFDNMHAYIVSLFLAAAVQIANICALWNPKMPWLVSVVPSVFYITIFVCSLIF